MSDANQSSGAIGPWVTDDELMAALREAWTDGERDPPEGGVRKDTLAAYTGRVIGRRLSTSRLGDRLRALRSEGRVVLVWGIDPETYQPRESYAPADQVEHPADRLPGDSLGGARSDD